MVNRTEPTMDPWETPLVTSSMWKQDRHTTQTDNHPNIQSLLYVYVSYYIFIIVSPGGGGKEGSRGFRKSPRSCKTLRFPCMRRKHTLHGIRNTLACRRSFKNLCVSQLDPLFAPLHPLGPCLRSHWTNILNKHWILFTHLNLDVLIM